MKLFGKVKGYKSEISFTLSNIITAGVSLITGIIAAAFVDPEDLGVIQSVLLIATYCSFLQLGAFNGLNRNLAYYKAKGDLEKMQDEIDTSHFVSVIVSVLGAVIGLTVLLYYFFYKKPTIYLYSSILLILTLVFTPLTTHVESTYRSGQQFARFSRIKNTQSLIYFIASFLPAILGYLGRIIANIINIVVGYILRVIKVPYKHKGKGSMMSFKDLLSAGFPLLLTGYIGTIYAAADKTFIASTLGARQMGLYTLSGYCISLFVVIPTALNMLLYPKAATRFGETGDKHSLLPFWGKSILLFTVVLIPLATVAYFLLPYCVEIVMPKYVEGIGAARITLLTCCTYLYMGPGVIFGTLKKNFGYIIALLVALGVFWLVVLIWKDYFTTIESIAWLRFSISCTLMLFVIVHSYRLIIK